MEVQPALLSPAASISAAPPGLGGANSSTLPTMNRWVIFSHPSGIKRVATDISQTLSGRLRIFQPLTATSCPI